MSLRAYKLTSYFVPSSPIKNKNKIRKTVIQKLAPQKDGKKNREVAKSNLSIKYNFILGMPQSYSFYSDKATLRHP